jgi:predicted adenine nucleotide alpha hydrolase (AANH) superfamily ATPase
MDRILLHICCGICASSVVQRLREENFYVVGFFYNPNIHPQEEYERRLGVACEVARILNLELIKGPYEPDDWFKLIKGLEDEPEGGRRCSVCFRMRLEETWKKASQMNISKFTTTLTVSPHKNATAINEIGKAIDSSGFLSCDFKKQEGFRIAIDFAKRYNLYRQNYCGCIYSMYRKERE